ncbi:MAG TPA: acyl-CoA dehydrogenase family protein [Streptosporangiaceae bacterium]|jgi:alkylation response protein AidB-like acyl-CoA dehydrogenase
MKTSANSDARTAQGECWGELLAAGWHDVPDPLPQARDSTDPRERIMAAAAGDLAVLPIPAQFGGGDGDLVTTASAQRRLGHRDPSVAVALNMHMHSIGLLAEHWKRHRDASWMLMEAIGAGHQLVGSAFAEPGGSANILRSKTRAVRTRTGFALTGTKFPCSLSSTAELFCLSAQVEDEGLAIVALCPAASPGLKVEGAWNSLGMRASDTARVELTEVEIDRRLVFHEAPAGSVDETVIDGLIWFVVLISATYHGVLSALTELAAAGPGRCPAQRRAAALVAAATELSVLGAACRSVGHGWTEGRLRGDSAMAAAAALRIHLSTATDRVLASLRPVLGAAVYTQGSRASGLVMDALAAHHHPPSVPLCEALIAAAGAGQPLSLDLVR